MEIYKRDLYLARGYSSMFLMATKEFGYDNTSAIRRTNALELALAVPSVLEKIDRGEMYLQTASDIQSFLNKERGRKKPYSPEQKSELVEKCSGLSCLKVQVELASLNPDMDFKESKRFVAKDRLRVTYTTKLSTEEKLERVRQLRSHTNPYMSRDELIDFMADEVLEKIDPARKDARREKRETAKKTQAEHPAQEVVTPIPVREEVVSEPGEVQLAIDFDQLPAQKVATGQIRYISAHSARETRRMNGNQGCTYIDPLTGRRCGSKHQLQYDHVLEFSRGGSSESANLQILCAKHNRFRWRQRSRSHVNEIQLAYG